MQIIGKCSICGGRVVKPDFDYSTVPSTAATCMKCGAVEDSLPTIKMRPKEPPAFPPVVEGQYEVVEIKSPQEPVRAAWPLRQDLVEFGGQRFMRGMGP